MLWTEKQTEDYLASETRSIAGPDGVPFRHTNFALCWELYDSLILNSGLKGPEMIGWAQEWVRREGVDLSEAMRGILALLDERRREAWGISHL